MRIALVSVLGIAFTLGCAGTTPPTAAEERAACIVRIYPNLASDLDVVRNMGELCGHLNDPLQTKACVTAPAYPSSKAMSECDHIVATQQAMSLWLVDVTGEAKADCMAEDACADWYGNRPEYRPGMR